jgi:8-oxo-dGTP pyrophosphatase MutT (NUDIX family)
MLAVSAHSTLAARRRMRVRPSAGKIPNNYRMLPATLVLNRQPDLTSRRPPVLTPERIAAGLKRPAPPADPLDLHVIALAEGTRVLDAAVLVPIVHRAEGMQLLFTQRAPHLDAHAGQISFPGGRVEPGDAGREETALRETEEEIGLPRSSVTLLGRLPEYAIPSGFRITPVVGWVEPPFTLTPDPFEVAGVFEAPLAHFLDPASYQRREYRFGGKHRHYMAVPYEGHYIWGATAGMLYAFCRMLASR